MSRLTRDGTAESVSRDQILRHARGQGDINFPCSADHEQDWQPYPVDSYSAICDDHTYIHTYILADLAPLQEQPLKAGPETALECAWRGIFGGCCTLTTRASCRGRRAGWSGRWQSSSKSSAHLMWVAISESKTETMYMPISGALATLKVFNSIGQQHRQITSFAYLGGAVTEAPNMSDEIDWRIRAAWISFRCHTREPCGRR